MIVRLGFAIATAVKPEILITDEVLAVGDESFQKKCIAWQEEYLSGGGTLLLCSHSMYHVQKLAGMRSGCITEQCIATDLQRTSRPNTSSTMRKRRRRNASAILTTSRVPAAPTQ
jgi:ABC-type dipeptide/oligopeptide/nickel transport system ATPase subunit